MSESIFGLVNSIQPCGSQENNSVSDSLESSEDYEFQQESPRKNISLQRLKRRASQARHRESVASCHRRLRKAVPFCDPSTSSNSKANINKANLLMHAKDYIAHLEDKLGNLIDEKNTKELKEWTKNSNLTQTMKSYKLLNEFKIHFAKNFAPQNVWQDFFTGNSGASYPDFGPNAFGWAPKKLDKSDSKDLEKHSPSLSEDLGFVSANNSQEDRAKSEIKPPIPKAKQLQFQEFYVVPSGMIGRAVCSFTERGQYIMTIERKHRPAPYPMPAMNNCVDIIQAIANPEKERVPNGDNRGFTN